MTVMTTQISNHDHLDLEVINYFVINFSYNNYINFLLNYFLIYLFYEILLKNQFRKMPHSIIFRTHRSKIRTAIKNMFFKVALLCYKTTKKVSLGPRISHILCLLF